jgi:hypothetical protein
VHATKNGVSIGEDGGGREEEDVSYGDTEFNHSHTIAKPAVSDLLKTVLCLLKVVINVSVFVNYDRMCRTLWRVSELQDVSLCRRWYILPIMCHSLLFVLGHHSLSHGKKKASSSSKK